MLTIAILAGGASRRMGRDKAAIRVGEESLLERTARIARSVSSDVLVVGKEFPKDWPYPDVPCIPDSYPGLGPLGGLATAIHSAHSDILLLPCDLPLLSTEALVWLIDVYEAQNGANGLICRNRGRFEPLFSCYSFNLLPLVEHHISEGKYALRDLIEAMEVTFADLPEDYTSALTNVNSPEDWKRVGR